MKDWFTHDDLVRMNARWVERLISIIRAYKHKECDEAKVIRAACSVDWHLADDSPTVLLDSLECVQ